MYYFPIFKSIRKAKYFYSLIISTKSPQKLKILSVIEIFTYSNIKSYLSS